MPVGKYPMGRGGPSHKGYTDKDAIDAAYAFINSMRHVTEGSYWKKKDKIEIIETFRELYRNIRNGNITRKAGAEEEIRVTDEYREGITDWKKIENLRQKANRLKQLQDAQVILEATAEGLPPPSTGGILELSEMPSLRQPKNRTTGALGDYLIVDLQPYGNASEWFSFDKQLKNKIITDLQEIHLRIQNVAFTEIGSPSPAEADYGKVPKETGKLRRSMRASVMRHNANVPDMQTSPYNIRFTMWLWANVPYAAKVSQYATNKVTCSSSPAVQHPFNLPKCGWQDYSRKTGLRKVDMGAVNDFFNKVLNKVRRKAQLILGGYPYLKEFFKIKIGQDTTPYEHISLARNL